jgi:membrane protein DedA with SNARE-associated domain
MLNWITEWVRTFVEALGYPGLGFLMFLENIFPPIPSEVVLPLAGSLTIDGPFTLLGVTLVGAAGSVAGAWFFYALGRWYGAQRTRRLIKKYGKWLLIEERDLDRSVEWFNRYGELVVFFGRMVPFVRSLIPVPAGITGMNTFRFTIYTAIGTAGWSFLLAMAGRLLGQSWPMINQYLGPYENAILIILAVLLLVFVIRRLWQRRHKEPEG